MSVDGNKLVVIIDTTVLLLLFSLQHTCCLLTIILYGGHQWKELSLIPCFNSLTLMPWILTTGESIIIFG